MIRAARFEDVPLLKALWMEAFQDSPEGTDHYFANRFRPEGMLVLEEGMGIPGMLSMLPIQLVQGEQAFPARYLFAIATAISHRGRGISSRLIEHALKQVKADGDAAAMLVPAGEDLFRFYGKRGFEGRFYVRRRVFEAAELPPCPADARVSDLDADTMLTLRDAAFSGHGLYARWGEDALSYVESAARAFGGVLKRLEAPGLDGYAYGEWEGDALLVKELAVNGTGPERALAVLHSQVRAPRYIVRLRDEPGVPGERQPFGMWVPFDERLPREGSGWLGLAKD